MNGFGDTGTYLTGLIKARQLPVAPSPPPQAPAPPAAAEVDAPTESDEKQESKPDGEEDSTKVPGEVNE